MNQSQSFNRFGSISNIIGGICVAIAYTLHPHHATPDIIAGDFWLGIHVLFALSLLFGVFGLISLFVRHISQSRVIGMVGFIMGVTSLIGISGLNFFEAFINPVIAIESPEFVSQYGSGTTIGYVTFLFPVFGVLFLFGYVLFCIDMLKSNTINRLALQLTIAGTFVFGVGLSGFLPMIVVQAGSVLFGAGLVALGIAIWKKEDQRK